MPRRTDFQKAITYTGQRIKDIATISYKIDGVRLLYRGGKLVTRNNNEPPGLLKACTAHAVTKLKYLGDCELYTGAFNDVQGPISRHDPEPSIFTTDNVYSLVNLDERLFIEEVEYLDKDDARIQKHLTTALNLGYEGLVIRTKNRWYRVKPNYTADVRITGWFEQHDKAGRPKGVLGGFETNYGKVTAFSDDKRVELWDNPDQYVGQLMQVTYKELYPSGSFRYAVTFNHFRHDKDVESFDTKNT